METVRVLFPLPLAGLFTYTVAAGMSVQPGSYVRAPLGRKTRIGVVWSLDCDDTPAQKLKSIICVFSAPPMPESMRRFIDFCARYNVTASGRVLAMSLRSLQGLSASRTRAIYRLAEASDDQHKPDRTPLSLPRKAALKAAREAGTASAAQLARMAGVSHSVIKALAKTGHLICEDQPYDQPFASPQTGLQGPVLTPAQNQAGQALRAAIKAAGFKPFLLDGVTGSGKTEIYFEAIAEALDRDDKTQILVLLPDIALTQALMQRFSSRFAACPAPWHSALGQSERRRVWREVVSGRARIVIGARSALFLPFACLGLIIVDEEHDAGFKQEDGVIYQARDMAVMRARLENAVIILSSATPALESVINAETGRYQHLQIAARPGSRQLPDIKLIDLRTDAPGAGKWLSPALSQALIRTFEAGEQSLIFLNRRGYAPLVICRSCGHRLKNPDTQSWLVEHRQTNRLVCHLTGWSIPKPDHCPSCQAIHTLIGLGPGVERISEEIARLIPEARIAIFSSDTVIGAAGAQSIISRMVSGQIDILVGTQSVAKGHNFPNLTLVGVVDADSGLKGGDLRAGERTYQLLSQVTGRAGRAKRPGTALIQTYQPDNPAMQALAAGDRDRFIHIERQARIELGLPPFGRMAALILSAPDGRMIHDAGLLAGQSMPQARNVTVYGPAPAPIALLRGRHRARFLVTAARTVNLSAFMAAWMNNLQLPRAAQAIVDIDPYSFL